MRFQAESSSSGAGSASRNHELGVRSQGVDSVARAPEMPFTLVK